jgi:DNA polymerase-3 subunit beta
MITRVKQDLFSLALGYALRAVSTRSSMPILGNVLVECANGRLRVSGTNREIAVNCYVDALVDTPGVTTVTAKALNEWVGLLPAGFIDIETSKDNSVLLKQGRGAKSSMKTLDYEDYPIIPTFEGDIPIQRTATIIEVPIADIVKMIELVAFSASEDAARPALRGIEVVINPDSIRMTGCDGYRISISSAPITVGIKSKIVVVVPATSLQEVARIGSVAKAGSMVRIGISEERNQIIFRVEGEDGKFTCAEVVSEIIAAPYPDCLSFLPKNATTVASVDTQELIRSLRLSSVFSRNDGDYIELRFDSEGKLVVGSNVTESGENESEIAAVVAGDSVQVGMNAKYLADVLSRVTTPQFRFSISANTAPIIMHCVGVDPGAFTHCIFPFVPRK